MIKNQKGYTLTESLVVIVCGAIASLLGVAVFVAARFVLSLF